MLVLADVAREAGVSTATVSLALQEQSRISPATRMRVVEAAVRIGYCYNRVAAKLRTGQSNTIGLIITDIANPFFAALAAGVEGVLDKHGFMTFLVNSGDDSARQERQLRSLMEHGVDGILLSPADRTPPPTIEAVLKSGVPLVQVSRWLDGVGCDVVAPDNVAAAADAVRHLVAFGHKRIAFIGGSEGRSARIERLRGYHQALADAGLAVDPVLTPTATPTRANGALLLRQILAAPNPPTALLCYHDLMALGALRAASEDGLKVGVDLAIIGFDDIPEAALSTPPLTTVRIDAEHIGQASAQRLLTRLEGDKGPAEHEVIPAHLVVRASCGDKTKRRRVRSARSAHASKTQQSQGECHEKGQDLYRRHIRRGGPAGPVDADRDHIRRLGGG